MILTVWKGKEIFWFKIQNFENIPISKFKRIEPFSSFSLISALITIQIKKIFHQTRPKVCTQLYFYFELIPNLFICNGNFSSHDQKLTNNVR